MQIISISETPNHNTMKITLSESREGMTSIRILKLMIHSQLLLMTS